MTKIKTTWTHVRRSPYQAFAAIFIMMQTFFVISLFTVVILGSARIISYFESMPQVAVFFRNEARQNEMDALRKKVESTGKASKIKFVSKQEALKIYREQNKDDPMLLELVTADVLPPSLEVSAFNIEDLSAISEMVKGSTIVSEIIYPKDVVSSLASWTSALRKIGAALIAVLALDSIFVMVIIIGIRISQKRKEIETVKLLGATNWYIRWPFIMEGIFYGTIGAIFGWALSSISLWYVSPLLMSFLKGIPIFSISPILLLELLGIEILLAIILGAFASYLAVLRYLK